MPRWAVLLTILTGVLFAAHATAGIGTSGDACLCDAGTNRSALMELYMATQGPSWGPRANWGASGPICDWVGLSCNGTGLVMNLEGFNLNGTLPDDFGAHLANLDVLTLPAVSFTTWVPLPGSLSQATRLRSLTFWGLGNRSLYQSGGFGGQLPASWSALTQLTTLFITGNFTGELPPSWANMSHLESLQVVPVYGALCGSLPESWGAMKRLSFLALNSNGFRGPLPSSWAGMTSLRFLDLSGCRLRGPLPPSWAALTSLERLYLDGNPLSGPLPPSWGSLTALKSLRLASCEINGPLPEEWATMSSLTAIDFTNSGLTGTLPESWSALQNLRDVTLPWNALTGSIPDSWGNCSFQQLSLAYNQFNGTLPQNWTVQSGTSIDLSYNAFTGPLPSIDSQIDDDATYVDASHNGFTGPFPVSWYRGKLNFDVSHNQLTGTPNLCAISSAKNNLLAYNDFSGKPDLSCFGLDPCSNNTWWTFEQGNNFCGECGLPNCTTCTESRDHSIAEQASIDVLEVEDSDGCCQACRANTACVAAVLVPFDQNTYCYLKNTSTPLVPKPGHTVLLL